MNTLNLKKIRSDFPILQKLVRSKPLIYLNNAATTQKPQGVLDAMLHYYAHINANTQRGLDSLTAEGESAYLQAREKVQQFINAEENSEIIFTKGTTESINLVAQSFGHTFLKAGDEVLLSVMEHHANIVPWQILKEQLGIKINFIDVDEEGNLDFAYFTKKIAKNPKILAITHVSNVLGTINPIKKIVKIAHASDVPVLLDGAQAIAHLPVDVQDLDCDFYAFSGHKIYAPTGIGVLYGKRKWLQQMQPYQGGGGMIQSVSLNGFTCAELPEKFEAGTQNIANAIALGTALDYLQKLDLTLIEKHEQNLLKYLTEALVDMQGVRILGTAKEKTAVVSFVLENAHPHDVATILERDGISVRAGHHCAMPLLERYKLPAVTRISLGLYNTKEEIDVLLKSIEKVQRFFKHG
ncbi:MAG: cysteine desulfurase [Gammaproteobacteria bacterium]